MLFKTRRVRTVKSVGFGILQDFLSPLLSPKPSSSFGLSLLAGSFGSAKVFVTIEVAGSEVVFAVDFFFLDRSVAGDSGFLEVASSLGFCFFRAKMSSISAEGAFARASGDED